MTPVTAPPEIVDFLSQVQETAEIRDSQGKVLGHYAPHQKDTLSEVVLPKTVPEKNLSLKEVFEHLISISPDEHRKEILREKLRGMS